MEIQIPGTAHGDDGHSGQIRRRTFIALHIGILSHVSYFLVIAVNRVTGGMRSLHSADQCRYVGFST
jgi:hypothetical protein